jgi:preprotein translocase subunit SecE
MAQTNPAEFFRQVREEVAKVTWPRRREVGVTTAMVFAFVVISAVFFLAVDAGVSTVVKQLLRLIG